MADSSSSARRPSGGGQSTGTSIGGSGSRKATTDGDAAPAFGSAPRSSRAVRQPAITRDGDPVRSPSAPVDQRAPGNTRQTPTTAYTQPPPETRRNAAGSATTERRATATTTSAPVSYNARMPLPAGETDHRAQSQQSQSKDSLWVPPAVPYRQSGSSFQTEPSSYYSADDDGASSIPPPPPMPVPQPAPPPEGDADYEALWRAAQAPPMPTPDHRPPPMPTSYGRTESRSMYTDDTDDISENERKDEHVPRDLYDSSWLAQPSPGMPIPTSSAPSMPSPTRQGAPGPPSPYRQATYASDESDVLLEVPPTAPLRISHQSRPAGTAALPSPPLASGGTPASKPSVAVAGSQVQPSSTAPLSPSNPSRPMGSRPSVSASQRVEYNTSRPSAGISRPSGGSYTVRPPAGTTADVPTLGSPAGAMKPAQASSMAMPRPTHSGRDETSGTLTGSTAGAMKPVQASATTMPRPMGATHSGREESLGTSAYAPGSTAGGMKPTQASLGAAQSYSAHNAGTGAGTAGRFDSKPARPVQTSASLSSSGHVSGAGQPTTYTPARVDLGAQNSTSHGSAFSTNSGASRLENRPSASAQAPAAVKPPPAPAQTSAPAARPEYNHSVRPAANTTPASTIAARPQAQSQQRPQASAVSSSVSLSHPAPAPSSAAKLAQKESVAAQASAALASGPTRPRLHGNPSQMDTQYVNMMLALDDIPALHNLAAAFFAWILLAGFILFPGTFVSLQTLSSQTPAVAQELIDRVTQLPLFVVAWVCTGVGGLGMMWLWWRWRKNYLFGLNKIFLPGFMNSLAGLLSTLASIYGAQHGQFSTTSKSTLIVTGACSGVFGILTAVYALWLVRRVKARHDREVGKQLAGKHGEGAVDVSTRRI